MKEFKLSIMSPGSALYEGEALSIVVPTIEGYVGILPGHVPLVSVLAQGEVEIKNNQEVKTISLSGGVLDVGPERVTILTQ